MGVFAVQIAIALGARVTAVTSTSNIELVRSLGADEVIDYTRDNVLEAGPCEVFFDVVANRSFRACATTLSPAGVYVTTVPGVSPLTWKILTAAARPLGYRKRCGWLMVQPNQQDLEFISSLVEQAKVRPIVNTTFALDEIQEANALSETGHASGKIVLRVAQP